MLIENRILNIDTDKIKSEVSVKTLKSWRRKLVILSEPSGNTNVQKLKKYNLILIAEIDDRIKHLNPINEVIRWFKRK